MTIANRLRIITVLTDWISTSFALLIFNWVRYTLLGQDFHSFQAFMFSPAVVTGQIGFPLVMLLLYWLDDYYGDPLDRSRLRDLISTTVTALGGTVIVLISILINDMTPDRSTDYMILGLFWLIMTLIVGSGRMIVDTLTERITGTTAGNTRCLHIVRNSDNACPIPPHLCIVRTVIIGDNGHETVQNLKSCRDMLNADIANCILIAKDISETGQMIILSQLIDTGHPIFVDHTPEAIVRQSAVKRATRLAPFTLCDLTRPKASGKVMNMKRLADISVATAGLIVLLPAIALTALIVKLDSDGPAFYCQERIGYHGRPFKMVKLRTMNIDAEVEGPSLTIPDDPRITRVGRHLRKFHLDELPQLWNVIKGDMSLVGPRPERHMFAEKIMQMEPAYALIRTVRPGLTSWGMVKYGYASTIGQMTDRLQFDLLYLGNISMGIDIKILFYTIVTVISGKGL